MIRGAAIDGRLTGLLDHMLSSAVRITARSVAKMLGVAPSTITRSAHRYEILLAYQEKQKYLDSVAAQADPLSKEKLVRQIADRNAKISELTRLVQLLTASHKALLVAVGELGGTAAWQRFFADYEQIRADLDRLVTDSGSVLESVGRKVAEQS